MSRTELIAILISLAFLVLSIGCLSTLDDGTSAGDTEGVGFDLVGNSGWLDFFPLRGHSNVDDLSNEYDYSEDERWYTVDAGSAEW